MNDKFDNINILFPNSDQEKPKQYLLKKDLQEEGVLCNKVTIDKFDYYITDEAIKEGDWFIHYNRVLKAEKQKYQEWVSFNTNSNVAVNNCKKIIATTNSSLTIVKYTEAGNVINGGIPCQLPRPINIVEKVAYERFPDDGRHNNRDWQAIGYIKGYNESQQTYPFTEDDMIEFAKYAKNYKSSKSVEKALDKWKSQRPEIVYYEAI